MSLKINTSKKISVKKQSNSRQKCTSEIKEVAPLENHMPIKTDAILNLCIS